jgi:predicted  nucleic acid-binding Zn-ribbon protein
MSQTLSLYRLQQIDSQMDHLRARIQEIQVILDDDSELRKIKDLAGTADARCSVASGSLDKAERDVQSQQIKIEQTQSSLYGGKSHSPKELLDLQHDVSSLKRYLSTLEDRQLEAMQESESAEASQRETHVRLSLLIAQLAALGKGLQNEQNAIKNELDKLLVQRNAVAGAVPPAEINLYDQLRQQRRGIAVTVISENSCGACGSTLSLAQVQTARSSGQMMLCPSCGRILYGS